MKIEQVAERLEKVFGGKIKGKTLTGPEPWIEIEPSAIREVGLYCRDEPDIALDYLKDLSAVDWLVSDPAKLKKLAVEPHLELLYQCFSFKHKHDIKLKVCLERWKGGKEGQLPEVPSVSFVWRVAEWHEREIYDLMGIRFLDHPNMCRILCPDDWEGHPLRKDYKFPLEYHGIRCQ